LGRGSKLIFVKGPLKYISTFTMLPNPILYSELESLLLWQHFFHLASYFLIAFSSLSIFLLNCGKECLVGLGFSLPFLAVRKLDFSVPFFLYLRQSLVLYVVCIPPCFLQRLQFFLLQVFWGTLPVDLVSGLLFPISPLWESFLLDCALDLSLVHTCSIALRNTHVHRCHTFLVKVELILPHKWAHPKSMTF
jgi:hypothetical protein